LRSCKQVLARSANAFARKVEDKASLDEEEAAQPSGGLEIANGDRFERFPLGGDDLVLPAPGAYLAA
jgi:hypothetical protein